MFLPRWGLVWWLAGLKYWFEPDTWQPALSQLCGVALEWSQLVGSQAEVRWQRSQESVAFSPALWLAGRPGAAVPLWQLVH